jgi:hypothetical protein
MGQSPTCQPYAATICTKKTSPTRQKKSSFCNEGYYLMFGFEMRWLRGGSCKWKPVGYNQPIVPSTAVFYWREECGKSPAGGKSSMQFVEGLENGLDH